MRGFTYIILLISLFSCKERGDLSKNTVLTVPKDLLASEKTICLDDVCSGVTIVPLETNPDILINAISKVCFYQDILFVFHDNQISCFDMKGKFLRKIGNRGEGPGEYTYLPKGVAFDGNYIYLSDTRASRILVYTIEGEFVNSFKTNCGISQLKMLSKDLLIGYVPNSTGNVPNKLYVYNREGQAVDSVRNNLIYEDFQASVHYSKDAPLFLTEDNLLAFKEVFCDTIFTIRPDLTFESIGIFDLGEQSLNPDDIYKQKDIVQVMEKINEMSLLEILYDSPDYMIFTAPSRFTCPVWDKKRKRMENVRFVYNDGMVKQFNKEKEVREYQSTQFLIKDGTPYFYPKYVSEDNRYLITTETSAANEEDNPVIVLVKMK